MIIRKENNVLFLGASLN